MFRGFPELTLKLPEVGLLWVNVDKALLIKMKH